MTRLIVKNLPKTISEDKLRSLFSQKGTVTDVQLKYTKEGVFRQFAFVGYQTDGEADDALKYFNNSCIQTSRIKIERCAALGAQEKPKSWSKYSMDSSAFRKKHGLDEQEQMEREKMKKTVKKKVDPMENILGEHKNDPQFVEFLQAHDKSRALWGNDAMLAQDGEQKDKVDQFDVDGKQPRPKGTKPSSGDLQKDQIVGNVEGAASESEEEAVISETEKIAEKDISDLEYMKSLMKKKEKPSLQKQTTTKSKKTDLDLFTIKIQGIPYKTKRQDLIKFFKPVKPYSIRLVVNLHGFCYVGFKTEKDFQKAMLKDKSFLKGKQVFFTDFTEQNKITKEKKRDSAEFGDKLNKNTKWEKQEESLKGEEDISESGRIFFRNLAYITKEEDLQQLFEKYGPVAEINLPIDSITRQIKGFGTVTFVMPEHALKAFTELDGSILHGRLLHLIPGKSKTEDSDANADEAGLGFKAKKNLKLKKSAQQSHNWNTLFLGANAVADILARQFGESKQTILDAEKGGSSAAVRLALGEAQIIIEMRKFLEENGIHLAAFESPQTKRSKSVILAKNLPADTTVAELRPLFAKYGVVGRIVLPPSGITAIIEFHDPSEARQAYKKLAYSKFKHLPLYLEWAPENCFSEPGSGENVTEEKPSEKIVVPDEEIASETMKEETLIADLENEEELNDDTEPPESETTLFLRNLNFKTREDAVRAHFKHVGPIHMVQIAMKKDPENPKNKISLGYGFIQFKKKKHADDALKGMHFTSIEGNQIELKRSDRILKTDVKTVRKQVTALKQTGTKIVVRNIPFQAKTKEVREIFQAFGNIKSVRLPKKVTTGEEQHRGFGFVDFFDKGSAKKAFDALCLSTHLYGRRLVLEWAASTDDDVDELRKRTAQSYAGTERSAKRSKKSVFDSDKIGDVPMDEDEND